MGRIKKHLTKEDIIIARRKYVSKYYYKNKDKIDAKARERYRSKLINNSENG